MYPFNTLIDIDNQFVVTPVNKADRNNAFICQQFYALVLIKEVGLDHNNAVTNKTCIPEYKTNNQVISGHTSFSRSNFNLLVDEETKKLSNIYWTPTLHKHPSKSL